MKILISVVLVLFSSAIAHAYGGYLGHEGHNPHEVCEPGYYRLVRDKMGSGIAILLRPVDLKVRRHVAEGAECNKDVPCAAKNIEV